MRIFCAIYLFLFIAGYAIPLSGQSLNIDDEIDYVRLGPWLSHYTDKSKAHPISEIVKLKDNQWKKFSSEDVSLPGGSAHHWLRCLIDNSSAEEINVFLSLEYAHIAEYQVYFINNNQIDSTKCQGDNYIFSNREMQLPYFVHDITFSPNSKNELYLRFDQEGQDLPLPISLRSNSKLVKSNIDRYLFHGISLGIIFIIALCVFFMYKTTKIKFLLLEAIVLILSIFYVISEEGYGFMYIWGDIWPSFNGFSRPASIGIISIMNLFVSISFLQIRKKNPTQYKITKWLITVFALAMILLHPVFLIPIKSENNIGGFIFFYLIFMALINAYNTYLVAYSYIRYKNKDALILLVVYAIIPLVIVARSLFYISNLPNNLIAQHGGIIVLTFHCVVIGGFMIYKSLQIFNDKQSTILSLSEDKRDAAVSMLQNLNNERERISMDIHDSLGSLLSGVSLNLQSLKEKIPNIEEEIPFTNSIKYITQLDEEMRNISHNLMPKTLKEFGLIYAIKKLIENEVSPKFNFEYQGFNSRLPRNIELEIYRMIFEIIDNIKKHAHAKNVLIQLNHYSEEVNLIMEDDGIGYRPAKIRDGANGLKNLRNRIKLLNGDIDIYTKVGEGTSIGMNIPIAGN